MNNKMKIQLRNDSVVVSGYVNAVERESRILHDLQGEFVEKVTAGTFADAIRNTPKIDLFFNHEKKLGDRRPDRLTRCRNDTRC